MESGQSPPGFLYGTEYTKGQINEALLDKQPENIIYPNREWGFGILDALSLYKKLLEQDQ